jgi:uncharacterized protein YbjQ (UPF0145 family)
MNNFCPNCKSEIKSSLLSKEVYIIDERYTQLINTFSSNNSSAYCSKCYSRYFKEMRKNHEEEIKRNQEIKSRYTINLESLLHHIPIVTLHHPQDWQYKTIGMVSAQSVTGTGVFAEIASNWTDFFGQESNIYNEKIRGGEERCKNLLRLSTVNLGGNAVLGADIDYSEAGGAKGMLMVCMSGTAIQVKNTESLDYNTEAFLEIMEARSKIKEATEKLDNLAKSQILLDNVDY